MALGLRRVGAVFFLLVISVSFLAPGSSAARAAADIGISLFVDQADPVSVRTNYSYALRLSNFGDLPAENAKVTLPVPEALRFISVTPSQHCRLNERAGVVECDFGTLAPEKDNHRTVLVTVRPRQDVSKSIVLSARASTSSLELITSNNAQSETTTLHRMSSGQADIGITRFEEVASARGGSVRSFEVAVRNFGQASAVDAKLVVMLPSLLKYEAVTPETGCQFNHESSRLSCELAVLEPLDKGGEAHLFGFDLIDGSRTRGAVKLKSVLIASGDDANVDNDMQELVVTLGTKGPAAVQPVARAVQEAAPEATAAIEKTAPADTTTIPVPDATTSTTITTTTTEPAAGTTDPTSSSGGIIEGLVNLFTKLNAGPSGGDVDFQIQGFETSPNEIPAGSNFTLTTDLINNGPGAANTATLDITVPEGVSFVSGPAGCSHDGNPPTGISYVRCSFGDLANGATLSVPLVFKAVIPGRVVRSFAGVIDSSSNETNAANNSQSVNATITNGADLVLSLSGAPNPAVAGGNVTYSLSVLNQGLNIAEGASVTFNLPAGIGFVSAGSGGNGWTCSAAGQVVTCVSGADIAALTGSVSFSIVGNIAVGSGTYTASGSVFSTVTPDIDGSNDTATFDLDVQPGTDLSVVKTVSQNPMLGGSTPSFTVTVTNNGPVAAQNLVLTDELPAGFTYIPAGSGGADWSCSSAVNLSNREVVTCTRATMAVGSSALVFNVQAPANALIPEAGQSVLNTASISSSTNDAVASNDSGSVSFTLQRDGADLAITLDSSPTPVAQNSEIRNSIRVQNRGPRIATGTIRATYLLDAGESYSSFTGAGWTFAGQSGNLLTFEQAGPLAVSAYTPYLSVFTIATGTGTLSGRACTSNGLDATTDTGLQPAEGDPVRTNNCATDSVSSTGAIADLVVSKTASDNPQIVSDDTQRYTITVRNDGPDPAVDVRLNDLIPNWVAAYDDRPATTIVAATTAGSCSTSSATVSCSLGDIQVGAANAVTVTIDVTRPVLGGDTVTNTASAYSRVTGDNDRSNNIASVTTQVDYVTDLKLRSTTWSPDPVKAGVNATYVITFRNNGRDVAENVALQSLFAGDFTFVSATPSIGACAPFGSIVANRLDCSIGTMGFGNQQTVTVVLRPNHQDPAPASWEITNSTSISTTTHETNLANNSGGTPLAIVPAEIDLDVTQTDRFDPVGYTPTPGAFDNRIIYQIDVTNHGPSYATGVGFTDSFTPPAGKRLRFLCDMETNTGQCASADAGQICTGQGITATGPATGSVQCTVKKGAADEGELAASESYRRYLIYEVLDMPVAGGETFQKQVIISANENDIVPANDIAEEQTTVRVRTDVAVACAAPPASVSLRQPFSLQLTVSNNGPGDSQETSLSQSLPTGLVLTGTPTPAGGGTCTGTAGSTSYTCTLGTLAGSATNVVTVPVRFVSYPSGGSYTTSASVASNEVDTDASNDSCATAAAGVVRSSIAGYVYEDHNDNGVIESGETGIAAIELRLTGTDAYGNVVDQTASTNSSGEYGFWNLSPSDAAGYTVTQSVQPAGYADGQENAGTNTAAGVVPGSHATDILTSIVLPAGQAYWNRNFGELPADLEVVSKVPSLATASIRQSLSYVIAVRNNGPASATASALSDTLPAGMELTGAPSPTVGACTGASGDTAFTCAFGELASGAALTVTVPVIVATIPGGVTTMTNTATASTSRNEVTLANNAKSGSVGVVSSSIACVVYQDYDNLGTKGPGEPGIGGVPMTLSGTDAFGNPVNLTQDTRPDGTCLFDNLSPSDANGYTLTQTQPAGFNDGLENNGGTVGETGNVMTGIVLAAGTHLPTHEFGELPPTGLSGTVWCDDNNNGVIDGSESTRIAGVTITLSGTLSQTAQTDANGYYHFDNLIPGTYTLTQTQNTAHACRLPGLASSGTVDGTPQGSADNASGSANYGNVISNISIAAAGTTSIEYNFGELRPASLSGSVFNDTSRDDVKDSGEPGIGGVTIALSCTDYRNNTYSATTQTAPDGTYSFTDLLPTSAAGCTLTQTQPADYQDGGEIVGSLGGTVGADEFTAIVLASGDNGTDYDFAERSAGISGHVYVDRDNDGVFDVGERPLAGVTIALTGTDANGAVSRTAVTDANGYYLFTGLSPSTGAGYTLRESQPSAWADGRDSAGSRGGSVANDEISAIVLTATDFATDYNFGELGGSLAGTVYTDLDNNGVRGGSEPGIPGVTLTLSCTDINSAPVNATVTTEGDGSYKFEDIPATAAPHCTISETQPPNTTDGGDSVGSLGGTLGNDSVQAIPVAAGEHGTGYDFGEILTNPARISGTVWHDSNHDRADNDNNPRAGWTVELISRDNPSDCQSAHTVVATQTTNAAGDYVFEGVSPGTYGVIFRSPDGGFLYAGAQSGSTTGASIPCGIGSIIANAGDDIIDQDLPLDPSGVVYDSLTRNPVPGATVTISGPAGFDPATHLVGGTNNVTQTTGADGYYQFWLYVGAPAGEYTLSVGQPAGYIPQDSAIIPACRNTLSVGATPAVALVQNTDTAPPLSVATHNAASCPTTSAGLSGGAGSTQYYFSFILDPSLPSGHVVNNHIPLDPVTEGAFTISKTTPKVNVSIGQLVPYTLTVRNALSASLPNMEIEDQIPPGFKYKAGSATLDGVRTEPVISGRQLTWPGLTFAANQTRIVKLLLMVGSGVSEGDYINRAWAENGFVQALASNVATAKVRVTADPTFDCAGVIGKVFDDKNRNGYQDKGEPGLANVRLATVRGLLVTTDKYGRYHVACADVPNADRGSNFIMKLDPRTLPGGYRLTTENPRVIRLTRGKIGKLNFGVAIHRVVRLDLSRDAFTTKGDRLKRNWESGIRRLVRVLDQGPSILRIAYVRDPRESRAEVRRRIAHIKKRVRKLWRQKRRRGLVIETESYLSAEGRFK